MDRDTCESLNQEYLDQLREVIPRAEAGDRNATDAFREIAHGLWRLNRQLANRYAFRFARIYNIDIDDCQSDAYLALYRLILSVRPDSEIRNFSALAATHMKYTLRNRVRTERRRRRWSLPLTVPLDSLASSRPSTQVEDDEILDAADTILGRIGSIEQGLFRSLRSGRSQTASARTLGISETAASRRLTRSFRVLRLRLATA
ncbi:MAG: sigma-70 family RNA polymerase sigma factor [Patescibacteria group bacterium]|nr:sigma-70 family RNA polymerase sigma factor [Patescibacteria group bacterium]